MPISEDKAKASSDGPDSSPSNYPDLVDIIAGDTTGVEEATQATVSKEPHLLAFRKALRIEFSWGLASITYGTGFSNLREFHMCLEDLIDEDTLIKWRTTDYGNGAL